MCHITTVATLLVTGLYLAEGRICTRFHFNEKGQSKCGLDKGDGVLCTSYGIGGVTVTKSVSNAKLFKWTKSAVEDSFLEDFTTQAHHTTRVHSTGESITMNRTTVEPTSRHTSNERKTLGDYLTSVRSTGYYISRVYATDSLTSEVQATPARSTGAPTTQGDSTDAFTTEDRTSVHHTSNAATDTAEMLFVSVQPTDSHTPQGESTDAFTLEDHATEGFNINTATQPTEVSMSDQITGGLTATSDLHKTERPTASDNGTSTNLEDYVTFTPASDGISYDTSELNTAMSSTETIADFLTTDCPRNMVHGDCTCQGTCAEPNGSSVCFEDCSGTNNCTCPDGFLMMGNDCVTVSECPCYCSELEIVITDNQPYLNTNCTKLYTCHTGSLHEDAHKCGPNAACKVTATGGDCLCNEGYTGDGKLCTVIYSDCFAIYQAGYTQDGIFAISPAGWPGSPFNVSCDMSGAGGWTVFQRRTDGKTDFYRNWTSYKDGFGSFESDFWLGNEKLYHLTKEGNYELRVTIVDSDGDMKMKDYSTFSIGPESDSYRLHVSEDGGKGMFSANGSPFSTFDRDNDGCEAFNCAQEHRGAWWHSSEWCAGGYPSLCMHFSYGTGSDDYTDCTRSSLNGRYNGGRGENIFWDHSECYVIFTEMKVRPSA